MLPSSLDRPLFRWAGSKRKLLPHLKRLWSPDCPRYLEPFAGSACLAMIGGLPIPLLP